MKSFNRGMWILSCSMWDLVSWLGIEPGPPILEVQSLSHWTTREVLRMLQVKATLGRSAGKGDSSERHRAAGLCCSTRRMISSWAGAVLGCDLVLEVSGSSVLQLPGCWSPGQWVDVPVEERQATAAVLESSKGPGSCPGLQPQERHCGSHMVGGTVLPTGSLSSLEIWEDTHTERARVEHKELIDE